MELFFENYWPHIFAALSLILGISASVHATMTKKEVRTAIGWVGVIMLSPILGALIYAVFGINRMRSRSIGERRNKAIENRFYLQSDYDVSNAQVLDNFGRMALPMKKLGDHVSRGRLTSGNEIQVLSDGDQAYCAMLDAINKAKRSILLETYIFDRDPLGQQFVEALSAAVQRGVAVRVLIDAVGARYSIPSIVHHLKRNHVPAAVFNGNIIIGLRLPYANLRTHRKILVVDNHIAFTGGMNIRAAFSKKITGEHVSHDTHFCVHGPVVTDLFYVSSNDWCFVTGEVLKGEAWELSAPQLKPSTGTAIRVVPTGPDRLIETNQRMIIGALSVAEKHIHIMTPYLLPDRELISALVTAARRGVAVDIIVPGNNNLKLVDRAMRAQFDQLLVDGCRIWRAQGVFNHSKLIAIDDVWSYAGSTNLDPRSLRLNFEIDLEIFDKKISRQLSQQMEKIRKNAFLVSLKDLKKRPFLSRLVDHIIWLGSPFL